MAVKVTDSCIAWSAGGKMIPTGKRRRVRLRTAPAGLTRVSGNPVVFQEVEFAGV